jgi:hypothetical protein
MMVYLNRNNGIEIPGTQSRIRIELNIFSFEQCTKNDENKKIEEE